MCATLELFFTLDLVSGMIRAVEPVLQHILGGLTKTAGTHSHLDSCIYMIAWDLQTYYNVIFLFSQAGRIHFWNRGHRKGEDCVLNIWHQHQQVRFISLRLSTMWWRSKVAGTLICGSVYAQLWIWQSEGLHKNLHYSLYRKQVKWEDKCLTKVRFFLC